jgi:hypothetical protein
MQKFLAPPPRPRRNWVGEVAQVLRENPELREAMAHIAKGRALLALDAKEQARYTTPGFHAENSAPALEAARKHYQAAADLVAQLSKRFDITRDTARLTDVPVVKYTER